MFENVDGRRTDAGVTGILIAHLGAFGSGELKRDTGYKIDTNQRYTETKIEGKRSCWTI